MALLNDIIADLSGFFGLEPPSERQSRREREFSRSQMDSLEEEAEVGEEREEEVVFIEPDSFSEVQKIVDSLQKGTAMIVKLEDLSVEEAGRVLNFISGAVYALDGDTEKLGEKIFLFTPSRVQISYGEEEST